MGLRSCTHYKYKKYFKLLLNFFPQNNQSSVIVYHALYISFIRFSSMFKSKFPRTIGSSSKALSIAFYTAFKIAAIFFACECFLLNFFFDRFKLIDAFLKFFNAQIFESSWNNTLNFSFSRYHQILFLQPSLAN